MPVATRTFRVFVSSTFEDLKVERNGLQKEVFPALRRLCEQHGARFQAIDLRWGVRDEAALDQKTVEICLREIERCQKTGIRPNFIVLLGQRYGWRPLPPRIEAKEFDQIRSRIPQVDLTLADSWYERDDNAVPAEFVLKPRSGKWVDADHWQQLETQLHGILLAAGRAAGLTEEALVKYWASATHQEILEGLGTTEKERRHVFAFCRDVPDEACDPDLADLRRSLNGQLPTGNFFLYNPGDLDGLCERVTGELSAIIESEARGFESKSTLELEKEAHDKFAHERSLVFGREGVLIEVARYLDGAINRPLVLHGASGSGKSAIMARASEDTCLTNPDGVIVRRFLGVSPESSNGLTLLRSLSEQIGAAYGATGDIPAEFNAVARLFAERLTLGTAERPLMVFLDALDQVGHDDPARSLSWLAEVLPEHCRMVVSTTERMSAIHECEFCEIEALHVANADEALEHWLSKANRTLTKEQRQHLLDAFNSCGLPLYLKLAFEEARNWPSWSPLVECKIGQGIEGVIDTLLDRLVLDTNHGKLQVSRGLGYLAAARYGLTEDEMLDVLSADQEVWSDFIGRAHHTPLEQRLPIVVWSRLSLDLEPYLVERIVPGGAVVNFYHRQLAERVAARFLADDSGQWRHKSLTEYFARQANWLDGETRQRPNARKAAELPWQQRAGGLWQEAEQTLLDCPFLFAKVESGLVLDLDADYRAYLKDAAQELRKKSNTVDLIAGALQLSMHVIAQDLKQFASQMTGRLLPFQEDPVIGRFLEGVAQATTCPWLRPINPALQEPGGPLIRTLEGHSQEILGLALTPDSRWVVSASLDGTLKVWDLETGLCSRTLRGHSDWVYGVAITPDSMWAVSGSRSKTLKVWDLETGQCLRTLHGHSDSVFDIAVLPDGRRAVSASCDATLKIWDLKTGQCLSTLEGHTGPVECVAVTPDGKQAVSASEKTLRVWDMETCLCLRTMEGHSGNVNGIAVTPDGKQAVSASRDKTLKVWDLGTGLCLQTIESRCSFDGVAVTPDGKRAISASFVDGPLEVWELETGHCLCRLDGHSDTVNDVAVSPDGKLVVSASRDKTLKVWSLEIGIVNGIQEEFSGNEWLTRDGEWLLSFHIDNTVSVTKIATGQRLFKLSSNHGLDCRDVIAPNGRSFVTLTPLAVCDLLTGRILHRLEGHSASIQAATITPNGKLIVTASNDTTLRVWDIKTGRCIYVLEGHSLSVEAVAVTPDSVHAVSSCWDGALNVWNLTTGRLIRTMEGHSAPVECLSITNDGKWAVSASRDRTIRIWEIETGELLRSLEGHSHWIWSLAVTPDGNYAVTASRDQTLKVWNLRTGDILTTFHCDAPVGSCNFLRHR
jgi:WD40 repeat protein